MVTKAKKKEATSESSWRDRLLAATRGTQLGAIARCALGRNDDSVPRFEGRASVTSDGFVMCDFVDRDGNGHWGAFVGSDDDLERNVIGVADHLQLSDAERAEWFAAMKKWVAQDWRS